MSQMDETYSGFTDHLVGAHQECFCSLGLFLKCSSFHSCLKCGSVSFNSIGANMPRLVETGGGKIKGWGSIAIFQNSDNMILEF